MYHYILGSHSLTKSRPKFLLQSGYGSYCRAVSVAVHFFFTAAFVWMLLEAIHVHSVLVRRHHTISLGKAQNMLIGKLEIFFGEDC